MWAIVLLLGAGVLAVAVTLGARRAVGFTAAVAWALAAIAVGQAGASVAVAVTAVAVAVAVVTVQSGVLAGGAPAD